MTKDQVLALLRASEVPISGETIAKTLELSRTAVWKAVDALRREGYDISSQPRRGYCLRQPTPLLSAAEIRAHLGAHPWAGTVRVFDCVDSTNNVAKQLAAEGAPEGTVIIAERQEGGRGRRGRQFASPPRMGVYLSVILRPDAKPSQLMHLTAAVSEATAEAVEALADVQVQIKWVNDPILSGKKLSGILTELSVELESGKVEYLVVGIGVNCCQMPGDFPPEIAEVATSIAAETGHCPDRNALAAAMIQRLSALSAELLTHKAEWMARYRARCITVGRQVQVISPSGIREGVALGLDENAALQVEFSDGTREWISSGEVSVRGLYGYV